MRYEIKPKSLAATVFILLAAFCCTKSQHPKIEQPAEKKGKRIEWEQSTLSRISSPTANANYSGYCRIAQLSDGSLLAVYEADGSIVSVRSGDAGKSWSDATVVAARKDGSNMSVPDLLVLNNNHILVFYNGRPYNISPSRKFSILARKSNDGGASWSSEQLLYEAGHEFKNGCWEPSAIQLPDGEIQVYFANEGPYTDSDEQNISMLRSADHGDSWTTSPEVVSFRPGRRDGMPVPLMLRNGAGIAVAIEDNAVNTFKPYIIKNRANGTWASPVGAVSPNRIYALADRIADDLYAGAPYLRQLSTGETIMSYQGTEGRTNNMNFADMKVVIGDANAENFTHKSVPFLIPANKSCLWNSLVILNDDTIIAVASTNAYSSKTEVWMIKGRLINHNK
ncbi:sialidase family protein [Pedobacter faecalis]|uniref:sialidase family protein n=1 Tax=Pedobacter faecalis TaxID=3041495 RepID=UPI002550FD62|nr:sialidase family protein [Pedobacter sp. ELA7]